MRKKVPFSIPRLLPLAAAPVLVLLIFFAVQTHRKSADAIARQHNLQHLRLIEAVVGSLETRLINMHAAFRHYATLIPPALETRQEPAKVCSEIERTFTKMVSAAVVLNAGKGQNLGSARLAGLDLRSESLAELERSVAQKEPRLLLLHSTEGKPSLFFLSPIPNAPAHLAVIVPFERLIASYRLNDPGYDEDYVWVLDRNGKLLYHRHHPEMVGRSIHNSSGACLPCHKSFELEREMVRGTSGYGWNEVPKGSEKIVAYAPLEVVGLHWVMAVSEAMDATTALVRRSTREYTINAILLSIMIFGAAVYITRSNYRRYQAEQEALHLQEERLLQQELDRQHRQLLEAERFATVGRMAAQMAHEIKNPLSSISLNTELLSDELEPDGRNASPETRQLIGSILSEIDLLTTTLDEYLQFARFPKLQKQSVSLPELVGGLQTLLHEESASRAIALQFTVDPSLPQFSADPRLLRQALLNLIRNSFEAIGSGGWVRVEANRANGDLHLAVMDSGPGVAREHLSMLFEPFFTSKPKGTGLGLPLTRHIIFEHGGGISYEPTDGAGARFVITLPLHDPLVATEQA